MAGTDAWIGATTTDGGTVWFAPGTQNLTPASVASTLSVGAPTVTAGAVVVTPSTIASTATVGAPTLTAGAVNLTPASVASPATVSSPTVAVGAVGLTPASVGPSSTVGAPTLTIASPAPDFDPITVIPRSWSMSSTLMWGTGPTDTDSVTIAGVPTTITSDGSSELININGVHQLLASVVVGTPTGSGAGITFVVECRDANGLWLPVVYLTKLTASGYTYATAGPGTHNVYVLTDTARYRWVLEGTSPSFPGVQLALAGHQG